jgi:uncharacterized membrane protein
MNEIARNSVGSQGDEPAMMKDTPGRSLTKAITWRIFGSLATFLVAFVIFRQYSEKGLAEVMEGATVVTIFDFTSKILLYYLHERLWTNINWGKYMRRHYWRQRAWKKLYRSKHNDAKNS